METKCDHCGHEYELTPQEEHWLIDGGLPSSCPKCGEPDF